MGIRRLMTPMYQPSHVPVNSRWQQLVRPRQTDTVLKNTTLVMTQGGTRLQYLSGIPGLVSGRYNTIACVFQLSNGYAGQTLTLFSFSSTGGTVFNANITTSSGSLVTFTFSSLSGADAGTITHQQVLTTGTLYTLHIAVDGGTSIGTSRVNMWINGVAATSNGANWSAWSAGVIRWVDSTANNTLCTGSSGSSSLAGTRWGLWWLLSGSSNDAYITDPSKFYHGGAADLGATGEIVHTNGTAFPTTYIGGTYTHGLTQWNAGTDYGTTGLGWTVAGNPFVSPNPPAPPYWPNATWADITSRLTRVGPSPGMISARYTTMAFKVTPTTLATTYNCLFFGLANLRVIINTSNNLQIILTSSTGDVINWTSAGVVTSGVPYTVCVSLDGGTSALTSAVNVYINGVVAVGSGAAWNTWVSGLMNWTAVTNIAIGNNTGGTAGAAVGQAFGLAWFACGSTINNYIVDPLIFSNQGAGDPDLGATGAVTHSNGVATPIFYYGGTPTHDLAHWNAGFSAGTDNSDWGPLGTLFV